MPAQNAYFLPNSGKTHRQSGIFGTFASGSNGFATHS